MLGNLSIVFMRMIIAGALTEATLNKIDVSKKYTFTNFDKVSLSSSSKSLSEGFANRPIERWHNEIRVLTKTRRGLGNNKSAQVYMDLARINHNYCRPHFGLPNQITPFLLLYFEVEAALLKLERD